MPAKSEAFANGRGAELYAAYQERLTALNACDFGDLLLHMLTIFRAHADVLEAYRDRFRYILVDEYQDTNASQYDWLRLLAEPRRNICCVGDDDQSIYSWRGAEVANILRFEKDFPGAASSGSNRITARPRTSSAPPPASSPTTPAGSARRCGPRSTPATRSRSSACGTGPRKRAASARRSRRTMRAGGSLDDTAILVRAQFQTREFEERFIAIGLAYQIVGGFRFYERAEIRDALAYLRLVAQPADDLAFERIVNQPKRGLGDKAVATIHRLRPRDAAAAAARRRADARQRRAHPAGAPQPRPLRRRHRPLAADGGRAAPPRARPHPARRKRLHRRCSRPSASAEAAGRLENLAELARAMEEYDSLGAFLEHVSLVMDNDAARGERQGHDHDHPRRQGPGIPARVPRRLGRRRVPVAARARRRRPRQPRGGAPPGLCRDHPRAAPGRRSSTPPTAASTASGPAASPAASSPSCPRTISRKKPP